MCETTCLGCGKKIEECVCHSPDSWSIPPWENTTRPWPPYTTGTVRIGSPYLPPVGDTQVELDDLHETLTSMRNRIDVLLELNEHDDLAHTIPTVLEDLYEDCQRLVEDYAFDH